MAPRTEQQFEEIRESRKKLILDTALELFATEGFHTTTISKIASKAGISKGLIYNYFESKEDLIKTIIFDGLDNVSRFFDPDHDGILTRDELKYFLEEFSNVLKRDWHFWTLFFNLFLQPQVMKLVEKRFMVIVHEYMRLLTSFFESNGYEDPEIEALLLGAILDGVGFHIMLDPENFPIDKVKDKLIKMYC
jgi:AcrR family transcriptional regulator